MHANTGEARVKVTEASDADKLELLNLLELREYERKYNRLAYYKPYKKQQEFHSLPCRERLLLAANQVGKTFSGAAEVAMHLTGKYPAPWAGKRFTCGITCWAGSVTRETTRDTVQRLLLGRDPDYGSGLVPKESIISIDKAYGIAGTVARAIIKNDIHGTSTLILKSYDQGREKWQGDSVDLIWFDEEPPEDIYYEGLTRTNATNGICIVTFTPLMGMSNVVRRFLMDNAEGTGYVQMTIDDAEHYTEEQRAAIISSYPEHEKEARTKGIPSLGSGRVFPVADSQVAVEPFEIPSHWPLIGALDFGYDHPAAAIKLAWDRDSDVAYVINTFRMRQSTPETHCLTLRHWGNIPWAWPHDGLQHDKGSGEQLAEHYRKGGLNLLPERATYPDGSNGLEAGVMDMLQRMQSNRLKVFAHLADWFEEFRLYHRKNGLIVKEKDDLMAATRYGIMCLRFAQVEQQSAPLKFDDSWIM